MISPIIIPLNKCNFKSCFTCTMEKKYAVQTIKIARVFPKMYYKRKRLLIMYSQNNILSPYIPCRLSESSGQKYLLSKKIMLSSNGHFFLFRKFLVYVSERKNMLFKNMLWKNKKKTCFIMHKLILDYNGVVTFELTSDLLSSVLCFKWSVFWKKSIPFSKKIH